MNIWKLLLFSVSVGLSIHTPTGMVAFAGTHMYSTEAENEITTGDVAISMAEYEVNEEGKEIAYQDGRCILPGQLVSKIVRITNDAEDAWIRVKVEYGTEELETEYLDDGMLTGIEENWKKIGDYYYCVTPVPSGAQVDFFRGIQIPSEWDNHTAGQKFQVHVIAQAIQKTNFTPDFSGDAPWFGVPIEACIHTERTMEQRSGDGRFEILFENGTEGFVKDSSDFFEDFSSMMPGDTVTGTLEFGSHFGKNLDISFRCEIPEEQSEASLDLLENLCLKIEEQGQILYEGSLWADELENGIELIKGLKKNETHTITYCVFMPEELTNAYALQESKVRWIFSTSYSASSGSGSGGSSGSSDSSGGPGVTAMIPESMTGPIQRMEEAVEDFAEYLENLPETGDGRTGCLLIVMLISGGAAFFLSSGESKKGEESEDE